MTLMNEYAFGYENLMMGALSRPACGGLHSAFLADIASQAKSLR